MYKIAVIEGDGIGREAPEMFGNSGAISGLLNSAESNGLGHIVQSWISTRRMKAVSS